MLETKQGTDTPDTASKTELAQLGLPTEKRQQAQHPGLTLTNLYNVVEQLRAGQPLTPKEQATNQ